MGKYLPSSLLLLSSCCDYFCHNFAARSSCTKVACGSGRVGIGKDYFLHFVCLLRSFVVDCTVVATAGRG